MKYQCEFRCIVCNVEVDETEFGNPLDADVCGYCFAAKFNEVQRRRGDDYASGLNACGRNREAALQADVEIHLEHAREHGNNDVARAYEHVLRAILG